MALFSKLKRNLISQKMGGYPNLLTQSIQLPLLRTPSGPRVSLLTSESP